MIKYNNNTIYDWNFDTSNLIKVYRNNAIVFYKVSGESPTPEYKVCFAVVDDITQYQETEFEDVFDNATEKWYKLNNLTQYEEYGVYGSGRTSCEGSSRLPQGYTEVEYIENTGTSYINTDLQIYSSTTDSFEIESKLIAAMHDSQTYQNVFSCMSEDAEPYQGFTYRYQFSSLTSTSIPNGQNTFTIVNNEDSTQTVTVTSSTSQRTYTHTYPLTLFCGLNSSRNPFRWTNSKFYYCKIRLNNVLVRDLVPCKRDSDGKYGMYDIVNDMFYLSPNDVDFSGGDPITPTVCVTTYKGKLTIDDDYEYEWNGSSWVNLGEVSGSTIPDNYVIPFEDSNVKAICVNNWGGNVVAGELTYGEAKQVTSLGSVFKNNKSITSFNELVYFKGLTALDNGEFVGCTSLTDIVIPNNVRYLGYDSASRATFSGCTNLSGVTMISGGDSLTTELTANDGSYYMNSSHANVPMVFPDREITMSGSTFGYYDYLANVYFQSSTPPTNLANADINNYRKLANVYCPVGSLSAYEAALTGKGKTIREYDFETDSLGLLDKEKEWASKTGTQTEYPKYYSEKSDPLDDLTFNTLAEAQTYAYNNCVYDGMKATIDGDRYYFDSEDENGWVKILEYYKVEDVTPNQASGWTISGSSTYNPDSSYYDDFDLETTSTSYVTKIAKVTIFGYESFTYYLRSYNYLNSSYSIVMASNIDEIQTPPASMSYNSSSAITNTYNFNKSPKSAVNLSNYRRVTYNNLDKTVEHTFYVYFYGRTYSSYVGNATILIPKDQSNENWEQVTFSSSKNVSGTSKNLYIDNNNSTSGGTPYWYYRWIVGLPSGSHSSYVSYSNYEYCPNVTSSTFTSVAGEQRQINFTYDGTTNKTLSFRLTDGNGNVLTPSDTVYYNMTLYNNCGGYTSSSNLTFPRSQSVKVGGSFSFSNSSNRHYIYGYQPPTLGTRYYVNNYSSTFDIVYTKLSDEAVTITYTTYDPNDSEIPAFKTNITYPYNGGTTSSTTLTSFDVPYTYPYEVSQTSDKFSADSQTYTANQAARTINFVLYPNNREFATVADMEAYAYAWEGMKAKVSNTKYQYNNGEWVEQSYTQYEYIRTQNAETIYYDFVTNFKPTYNHTLEIKVEFVDRSIDWGDILSWDDGTSSHGFSFQTVTSSYQAIVRTGGNGGVYYRPTIGANKPTVFTLPMRGESGTYSVNGGSSQTIRYNYSYMYLPANIGMCFFGRGTTSRGKAAVAKMYYVKVYDENENLVKHYVPSDNNGTPCFYEIVDGEYIMDTYTGSSHGTLTLGPEVS